MMTAASRRLFAVWAILAQLLAQFTEPTMSYQSIKQPNARVYKRQEAQQAGQPSLDPNTHIWRL